MNLILPIYSVLLLLLLIIVYFSKVKIKSDEAKLYCTLLVLSACNVILNIWGIYLGYHDGKSTILTILNHLDLPLYFWMASIILIYLLYSYIFKEKNNENLYLNIKYSVITLNIIFTTLSIFFPFEVVINEQAGYAIGFCVNFVYIVSGVYLLFSVIVSCLLIKYNFKKTIPIIVLLVMGIMAALIQKTVPSLIIIPAVMVFVELIMYFTIENPDIKMMKELKYSKEVIERSRNDTLKVIQEMENDLEDNLEILEEFGNKKINKNNLQEVNDEINNMQKYSLQLVSKIDGLLSLAKIDSGQLEVRKDKYEISNLYEEIRTILEEIKNKYRVDYELVIDKKDNFVLYGDKEKIKGIVLHMILGIVKDNDKKKINIRINNITVGNICRLKIHIDTRGIIIDKNSFDYKIVFELENMIKGRIEEYDNEIVLISDERRMIEYNVLDKDNSLIGNTNGREYNDKRVLLVINDKKKSDKLKKVLNTYKIRVNTANDLSSMIDKIDKNKTYDMILLDDMVSTEDNNKWMEEYNSKSIYKYTNYKIPVVIMVHENKDGYEKEYMRHGFDNYLMKNIKQDDLDKILDKYLK